jgi:hypothetical protein
LSQELRLEDDVVYPISKPGPGKVIIDQKRGQYTVHCIFFLEVGFSVRANTLDGFHSRKTGFSETSRYLLRRGSDQLGRCSTRHQDRQNYRHKQQGRDVSQQVTVFCGHIHRLHGHDAAVD